MCWYVPEYVVFYIYFKNLHHFDTTILYCIRARILSQVNFLVYCYFYRYLVIVFLLSCMSYLYFIWRWLSLCMYSSGVDEIKNVNQSINKRYHATQICCVKEVKNQCNSMKAPGYYFHPVHRMTGCDMIATYFGIGKGVVMIILCSVLYTLIDLVDTDKSVSGIFHRDDDSVSTRGPYRLNKTSVLV